jgi:glycosyltransferase involved in cell wall biosynthesis
MPKDRGMTSPPLVSIVVPCYNQGRFVGEAIESALGQTYPHVEVIVVDDGSTDDTASVARRYEAVRCIQQPNRGTAAARNRGFRESRGEYVVFLDADDRLLPLAVATGLDCLAAHPEWGFAAGHVRLLNPDGSAAATPPQDHEPLSYLTLLRSNYIWTPGVVMYRRTVLDAIGGFRPSAGGSADYDQNIRVARQFEIGCHHEVVLEYRKHDANMTADAGYMLASAVSVRRSLRNEIRGNQAAEEAWQEGMATVRADFGKRLVQQVVHDLRRRGRRPHAIRGMLCMLRYHPAGFKDMLAAVGRGGQAVLRW